MRRSHDPSSKSNPIDRRLLLRGSFGVLVGGTIVALTPSAASSTALSPDGNFSAASNVMYIATTIGTIVEVPLVLGGELVLSEEGARRGVNIRISWDDRLYTANDPVLVTENQIVRLASLEKPRILQDGRMSRTIKIVGKIKANTSYVLQAGSPKRLSYPEDIIESPMPTEFEIIDQGNRGKNKKSSVAAVESLAGIWGVSMGVSWIPVTWGDGLHTWRPQNVTLRSVGPDPIPAGTKITAQLDSRLFPEGVMMTPLLNDVPPGTASGSSASLSLAAPLVVGSVRTYAVSAQFNEPRESLQYIEHPLVIVHAPEASVGQRLTGSETATRMDSAFNEPSNNLHELGVLMNSVPE